MLGPLYTPDISVTFYLCVFLIFENPLIFIPYIRKFMRREWFANKMYA